ncbi:ATP-grasp domain-containing protein [Micromonospora cathayae]|uniref:ATP-grasp domain-containing protein n=1 Tax=Micromonospora cathayae TaxID=3028804 RepID=A0ABY7ZY85_9ACTN|nr:ATP-grasp domain-containing protein [Micromonospora sp. HUAS 3]WDZ87408.1 ATP-grasp domain-containing protein [Micromonospora sp. HUAS 3]
MALSLGRDELVIVGVPPGVLGVLGEILPAGSTVIVEDPDVIRRRDLHRTLAGLPYVSRVVPAAYRDGLDLDALLAAEPGLAAARVVMPGLEYTVTAAARLAERLGRPGGGPTAAATFTDKHRMRRLAADHGLPNPAYALVSTPAEAEAFARRVGGPCVLKPTRRAGSLGVQLIDDPADIAAAWTATACPDGAPEQVAAPTGVLVEARLTGPEHSVELLLAEGEVLFGNVTGKRVLPGRHPVETGHTVPAALPDPARRELLDAAARLAAAAGFRTGVLHSEWIVVDGVPTLVECAARLPGDLIAALIAVAYEVSFVEAYLRVLAGERPTLPDRATGAAAVEFLLAPPGTVTAVEDVRQARRSPGVLDLSVDVAVGDRVVPVVSSGQRSGHVLTWGADPAEAERNARTAAARVRFTVT